MTHRKPVAINARTGEPLNADALPEHGGDCWGANCSGDCAEKTSLIRRSMAFLLGVVEKPIDMITDEELAAAEEVADILTRAKLRSIETIRDRYKANLAILHARTDELRKVQAENEALERVWTAADDLLAILDELDLDVWGEQADALITAKAELTRQMMTGGREPAIGGHMDSGAIPDQEQE